VRIAFVISLAIPIFRADSVAMYGDAFAFIKGMRAQVVASPYAVCAVAVRTRPIAKINGWVRFDPSLVVATDSEEIIHFC
jgi:hypothetical protein